MRFFETLYTLYSILLPNAYIIESIWTMSNSLAVRVVCCLRMWREHWTLKEAVNCFKWHYVLNVMPFRIKPGQMILISWHTMFCHMDSVKHTWCINKRIAYYRWIIIFHILPQLNYDRQPKAHNITWLTGSEDRRSGGGMWCALLNM